MAWKSALYLGTSNSEVCSMMRMYTKDTLNELDEDVKDCLDKAQNLDKIRWNKDYHNNLYERQAKRLLKLRKLLERDLTVEFFGQKNFGLVLVNNKFVVCLLNNEWRTVRKNKWYKHKRDLDHFIDNYILGDKNEANA